MGKDKISVIIPVYNVEKYLDECIKSVLMQTYKNLEIILVDDGSTDQSGRICDKYAKIDERIYVIHKSNGGLSDARNAGLEIFSAEYVTFVDSDDYVSPIYIEKFYDAVNRYPDADMVIEKEYLRFMDGKTEAFSIEPVKDIRMNQYNWRDALEQMLYQQMETGAVGKLYKKELFTETEIKFPFGLYYEDLATIYRLMLVSKKIVRIDCKIYAYRIRKSSIMHQKFSVRKMDSIPVSKKLFHEIQESIPELASAAASRSLSVNRTVYSQIPYRMRKERKRLWQEIIKYRKIVLLDCKARKRERLCCGISYLGQPVYYFFNWCFVRYKHYIKKEC